ncbi:ketopantoate reductase family protein [Corynebacterium sp. 335C]
MTDDARTPSTTSPARVAVLGAGGVGGVLAGLLARAGHDVTVVASERSAEALAARDGRLTVASGALGDADERVRVVTRLDRDVDLTLVTVKHTGMPDALDRIPAELAGTVVPFLNGVEHVAVLRERYGDDRVPAATVQVEATRVGDGEFEHTSTFLRISLSDHPAAEAAAEVLRDCATEVNVGGGDGEVMWNKLALLAPMALLTGGLDATMGDVLEDHRDVYDAAVDESAAIAAAEGATNGREGIDAVMTAFPAAGTTSLARDLDAGRPTEADAIAGAVIRAGRAHGLPTATLEGLLERVRDREAAGR